MLDINLTQTDVDAAISAIKYAQFLYSSGSTKANVTRNISTAGLVSDKLSRHYQGLSRREVDALLFCLRLSIKDVSRISRSDDLDDDLLSESREYLSAWRTFITKLETALLSSAGDSSKSSDS